MGKRLNLFLFILILISFSANAETYKLQCIYEQGGKKTRQLDSAVIHDGTRLQPLLCLVRTSCAESLQVYLQAGGVSVHRWLATLHCAIVSYNNTGQFLNINTLAELHDSRA